MLPQEIEEGNIEYKRHIRKIDLENPSKITKFKTQLLWRLSEGRHKMYGLSEAIYYIGIEDDGSISGLSTLELNDSIKNFTKIVKLCGASIVSTQIENNFAKIIIQKSDNYVISNEIKVGLLGSSNNGKSSFLGVLTFDIKDDGHGLARSNILRHDHEKQNGMTSSIKYEIIGYTDDEYINYNSSFIYSWEYIVKNSKSVINFIDLPGSHKYIKTTLFGLMAHRPDHALIFLSLAEDDKDNSENKNTIDLHIDLCTKLEIPFTIVQTKKDLANNVNPDLLSISNVTGEGIDSVKKLLKQIKIREPTISNKIKTTEFVINDTIIVPDIGTVLTGILNQGRIKINDELLIGPYNNTFYTALVLSIHKKQIPSKHLYCGEMGTLIIELQTNKINIDKHMMLVSQDQLINFKRDFKILINKNNIVTNQKYMGFCRNIYDTVTINIDSANIDNVNNIYTASFSGIQYIKNNEFIVLKNNNELIVGKIVI